MNERLNEWMNYSPFQVVQSCAGEFAEVAQMRSAMFMSQVVLLQSFGLKGGSGG
jgi:hypothetical protein